ncbi:MAG: hypothetical protein O3A41_04220 [Bacteroidetes bacterium]|nr:hypothetical protein [Bacteroidota bacterium]
MWKKINEGFKEEISQMRSLSQSKIYERISESVRRAKEACRWKYWPKAKNGFNLCKKQKIDEHEKYWGIGSR